MIKFNLTCCSRIKFKIENAARAYGLPDAELFQTVDLFEKRNIAQVTQCIHALGRQVRNSIK